MKYISFLMLLMVTNTALGADLFYTFFCELYPTLVANITLLPTEIRRHICGIYAEIYKEHNQKSIKAYIAASVKTTSSDYFFIEEYLSFKDYGCACTHVIAIYPKKGGHVIFVRGRIHHILQLIKQTLQRMHL